MALEVRHRKAVSEKQDSEGNNGSGEKVKNTTNNIDQELFSLNMQLIVVC